jgi:hypothetical protein
VGVVEKVVVKDDRINAHNTFNNKQQVLDARAMTGAALFARMSDTLARKHAETFTMTSTNAFGVRLLTTRGAGGRAGEFLRTSAVRLLHLFGAEER